MRRRASLALALVAALAIGGCSDGDRAAGGGVVADRPATTRPTVTVTATSETGVLAGLEASRLFATRRELKLALSTTGDQDVAIGTVVLDSPLFERVEPSRRDTVLVPGRPPIGMPLGYGAARCDQQEGATSVVATVDGREERLPVDAPSEDLLRSMHEEECDLRRLTDAVEVRFGDDWDEVAPRQVAGQLEVRAREPGTEASVHDLRGSVIFTVAVDRDRGVLAEVGAGREAAAVDVTIDAGRCDPHGLLESKKTFVFTVWLALGDEDPRAVELQPQGNARQVLDGLLADCAT